MEARIHTVLFLCTGNSARSVLAEAILNDLGRGRFKAYSAGSKPVGRVNPLALVLLAERGHPVAGLHSKPWEEFARPGAPRIDIVLTVCDSAAQEACPVWPGHPVSGHWGIPDPAAVDGPEDSRRAAFGRTYQILRARIEKLCELELDSAGTPDLRSRLAEIGQAIPGGT